MKKALIILVLSGLLCGAADSSPVALVIEDGGQTASGKRSIQIGLDIRFDADWISFSGNLAVGDNNTATSDEMAGVNREVQLGTLPTLVQQTRKGIALIRAFRTTTLCLVKEWLRD